MDKKGIYSQLYQALDPLVTECVINRIRVEAIINILVKKGICVDSDIDAEIEQITEIHRGQFTESLVTKVMQGLESLKPWDYVG